MSVSILEFWKLAVASGLLSAPRCKELHAAFAAMKGAAEQANCASLAEWLVAGGALSRYQASLLAAGRPGPFVFGDFVVCERIETGRLAHCYRATYKKTQTVLLIFAAQLAGRGDPVDDIEQQTAAAATVRSPHVNRVYQFQVSDAHAFVVLGDLAGQSLREALASQKFSWEAACRVGFQAALGLVALHAQGIVHGGVCPENLWIDSAGTTRLLQFPLARDAAAVKRFELPAADYLAPELADADQACSPSTDLYALGCTLFELLVGRAPFAGGTMQQKLRRHQSEVPQRVDRLMPGVPEDVADLVAEMVDKEPLLRCQTASQVAHLLAPLASGSKHTTAGPPRLDSNAPRPGYGVWQAPAWQPPPQQATNVAPKTTPPADRAAPKPTPAASEQGEIATAKPTPTKPAASKPAMPKPAMPGTPMPKSAIPNPVTDKPRTLGEATPAAQPKETAGTQPDDRSHADAQATREARQSPGETAASPGEETPDADAPWEAPRMSSFSTRAKASQGRFSNTTIVGAGVALALVAVVVVAGFALRGSDETTPAPLPDAGAAVDEQTAEPAESTAGETAAEPGVSESLTPRGTAKKAAAEVDDDGETLWAAPPGGAPLTLDYLPSGAQVILVWRPAELLASSEGAKLFDALGPAGELAKTELTAILGVELTDVEQLTIAWLPNDAGDLQTTFSVRLRDEIHEATLLERWSSPRAAEHGSKRYFQGARFAYYLPADGAGRVVVISPDAMMQEILAQDGPPLLRKGIERLLRDTDSSRQFNLLLAPSYLLTDGKGLLVGSLAQLRDPLAGFLDETIEAVSLSAQLGDDLFLELRAIGTAEKTPQALGELLRTRLDTAANEVETYVASLDPQPYGRLIVMRFPRMMRLLSDYTRSGAENRQAVLRCYLPGIAAHNLLLGADLALLESPGEPTAARPRETKERPTAAAALRKKISLSFPRDTLERCLEMLSKEIDVDVVILGPDLQLEGITKNQSFGLDERQQPAGDILQKVLKLANPQGKLVYVVRPQGDREAIFVTTRAAAAKRGEKIPPEFDASPAPQPDASGKTSPRKT